MSHALLLHLLGKMVELCITNFDGIYLKKVHRGSECPVNVQSYERHMGWPA